METCYSDLDLAWIIIIEDPKCWLGRKEAVL